MWNYLFAFPLVMHGLANLTGVMETFGPGPRGFNDKPWVFSAGVKLQSPIGRIFGLFWLLSTLLLVASGLGLIFNWNGWEAAAILGCTCSFIAIAPWWNTVVPGARFGALFDVAVILALLLFGEQISALVV